MRSLFLGVRGGFLPGRWWKGRSSSGYLSTYMNLCPYNERAVQCALLYSSFLFYHADTRPSYQLAFITVQFHPRAYFICEYHERQTIHTTTDDAL